VKSFHGDERMPWPGQRRRALILVNVIDEETFCNLKRVMHEEDSLKDVEEGNLMAPFDTGQSMVRWSRWKEKIIERYKLGNLATQGLTRN